MILCKYSAVYLLIGIIVYIIYLYEYCIKMHSVYITFRMFLGLFGKHDQQAFRRFHGSQGCLALNEMLHVQGNISCQYISEHILLFIQNRCQIASIAYR